ncbi:MAG TPA: SufD family Fe-S cluster assembly protein [Acidimicrobiales bacterium]|nr:SufD family Fe-S cluster assembly protein [Acidimicrobiales bacterium]
MSTAFSIDTAAALSGPPWLVDRRRAAAERFAAAELPTADEEVWRYSRIADLALDRYRPATADDAPAPTERTQQLLDAAGPDTVVVRTAAGLPVEVVRPDGSRVEVVLPDGLGDDAPLGAALGPATDALTALHDAFTSPVVVRVPEGVDAGQIVVIHDDAPEGVASFPRLVVEVGQAASAAVVEVHHGADGVRSLSLPVTELLVGRDATLRHSIVQVLGDAAWQIGRLASSVDQGGALHTGAVALGGDYARLRVDTALAGRGAHGDISAAYFGDGTQLLDFRTFQDHVAPDTTSNLLFKGALGEKGASVYTGLIKIRPEARGTQAFQTNRNIKLSDDAWAESVPNLEIENNEVQCSHASTVGPVDPEQLFYLESRGVPTGRATRLIVRGFFDEVVRGLELGPFDEVVRRALEAKLERSLP